MNQEETLRAMADRHAVRRYLDQPIPPQVRAALEAKIRDCNQASGLSIQIRYDDPAGFSGGILNYGSLHGVRNYLILAGHTGDDIDRLCGYQGEQIVLEAQHLGLNSCWVALTFNKRHVRAELAKGDEMVLVVALGYGADPGKPHRGKPVEDLGRVRGGAEMPGWFRSGLEAAALAPTALNRQDFAFELEGEAVHAIQGSGSYGAVNLGIASYHFEVGAAGGQWHWA